MEIYQDSTKSSQERAENLLSLMTLREKVGQLNQRLYGFQIYERDGEEIRIKEEFCNEVEHFSGLGVLYGLYRADPWSAKTNENGITPEISQKAYNTLQEYVITHSRLGIPMLMSSECPHGHQALGGSMLPVNFAAGCTFEPELLREAYKSVGEQLKDGHVNFALMSVLDVLRDPRWGRSEECYSEDPYLSAQMAAAAVSGMQETGVAAVAKHFCAQGEGTGGINASAARIGERELREIHIPAMEACCEVGVKGVMAAYNEIDGVYCHANSHLLKDILRKELGFDGIVMADGIAVDNLNSITGDFMKSGALAKKSGVDVSLWDKSFYLLDKAVEAGLIEEKELDEAVLKVLKLKFEQGLFEHPYMDRNMQYAEYYGTDSISQKIAENAVVLLKNEEGILPLTDNKMKIAVIGPNADDIYRQLGDYTSPVTKDKYCTVRSGMEQLKQDNMEVHYVKGCDLFDGNEEELNEAVELAKQCDIAVLVLGGSSSRYEGVSYDSNGAAKLGQDKISMECGEGMDVAELELPAIQRTLVNRIAETGTKIVSVIVAGRPYAVGDIETKSAAMLYAPYGGAYAGAAVSEIIYGIKSPQGRLAYSLPRNSGQIPVYYNYKNSYGAMKYCNLKEHTPLHVFGEGMAYTSFEYGNVQVIEQKDGSYRVELIVTNNGNREGAAVPQIYIQRLEASTTRRIRELKAFKKVRLQPGTSEKISLVLERKAFGVWNPKMEYEIEPGKVQLYLCDNGKEYWSNTISINDNRM